MSAGFQLEGFDELSRVIESLPEECGCLVLTRRAVLASRAQLTDLTPAVPRRPAL